MRNFSPVLKKVLTREFRAWHQCHALNSRVSTFFNCGAEGSKIPQNTTSTNSDPCTLLDLTACENRRNRQVARFLARERNLCVRGHNLHVPAHHGEPPKSRSSSLRTTARKVRQTRFPERSLDLTACENHRNRKVAHFSRANATYASVNATCMWPLSSMLFGPFQCCTFFDSFRSSIFGVKSTKIALVGTIALTMGPCKNLRPLSTPFAKKPSDAFSSFRVPFPPLQFNVENKKMRFDAPIVSI